jgi:hypothetical protein
VRTLSGVVNLVVGMTVIGLVTFIVPLDFPVNAGAVLAGALLVIAGVAVLGGASWGTRLAEVLGLIGSGIGVLLLAGALVALFAVPDWGGLVSAVLAALGAGLLAVSAATYLVNRSLPRT